MRQPPTSVASFPCQLSGQPKISWFAIATLAAPATQAAIDCAATVVATATPSEASPTMVRVLTAAYVAATTTAPIATFAQVGRAVSWTVSSRSPPLM